MNNYITDLLRQAYKGETTGRNEASPILHVSQLGELCARRVAYCMKNKLPLTPRRYLAMSESLTYKIGSKIQDIVASDLFKANALLSSWKCIACGYQFFGHRTDCPKCKTEAGNLRLADTLLTFSFHKRLSIRGSVDIFVLTSDGKEAFVLEVKSIKVDEKDKSYSFDHLTHPLFPHASQTIHYLWMLRNKKVRILNNMLPKNVKLRTDIGVVLYVAKQQKKMPFKPFTVRYDNRLIDTTELELKRLRAYLNTKRMPVRQCKTPSAIKARSCSLRFECFKKE